MRRILISTTMCLVCSAFFQTLALKVSLVFGCLFMGPLILVFSIQYFRLIETLVLCLSCGAILDILGGFPVGYNMLLMLSFVFLLKLFKILSSHVPRHELMYYVFLVSFLYRLAIIIVDLIVQRMPNISFLALLGGPFVDGILSIFLYPFWVKVLSIVKVIDQNDYFRNRIGLSS